VRLDAVPKASPECGRFCRHWRASHGRTRTASANRRWLDRWLAACHDLAQLERSNSMTDAVIDEVDGRMIRIGDRWLADFASCNYLGFDLDREIIAAVPEYLERWGTHPPTPSRRRGRSSGRRSSSATCLRRCSAACRASTG
jgi:hypothetical protein